MESLCKLCNSPASCVLCEVMRNPRPLTTARVASIARAFNGPARPAPAPVIDTARMQREAALRAEIEAERAKNAALRARVPLATPTPPPVIPDPQATVPTAPRPEVRPLAPAPAPMANPFEGVDVRAPLRDGDWLGLAARVEAGVLTQSEAERIGSRWQLEKQRAYV